MLMLFLLSTSVFAQNVIDITVKGISDQQNDGAQQDRLEAILDAKKQACEKAGITIQSTTTVENFQVVYDLVETQAATVLLPGFQLVEIGYVQDGTYQVVLSGKIKLLDEESTLSSQEMRYAKSLRESGKDSECSAILKKYMDSEDPAVSAELKEEANYYYMKWGYAWNIQESFQKFAAFYPESKYLPTLESFSTFAAKPIYVHDYTYKSSAADWKKIEFLRDEVTFTKRIGIAADTIIFKNFQKQVQSILFKVTLFSEDGSEPRTAYHFILSYFNGDVTQPHSEEEVKVVDDRFKVFQAGGSLTFQHSSTGEEFADYNYTRFQFAGDVPAGRGPFQQRLQFEIYQLSF
jgi:hypothetical protein